MLGRGSGQRDPPLRKIVKTLASGVGLASEAIQHHKEKKAMEQNNNDKGVQKEMQGESSMVKARGEEEVWQLDELQDELARDDGSRDDPTADPSTSTLADEFIETHQHPPPYSSLESPARLELPVIITQKRPKDRARGFIRAYAPLLQDVGIDQDAFLDFIDNLNKAVEPSKWIQAINLASLAAQKVPEPVTLAVSVACKMVADAASATHSRYKTNMFLDRVNDKYFKPKGLVALLVTWAPSDPSMVTDFGFELGARIQSASSSQGSGPSWKHRLQSSSGTSSFEFPETAPLVFPALDTLSQATSENDDSAAPEASQKQENVLKRGGAFLADYQDRRAVAEWAGANPDSTIANAAPKAEFRSRYSDPNHPASSGDPLAFVTGGKYTVSALRGGREAPFRGGFAGGPLRGHMQERRQMQWPARGHRRGGVVRAVGGLLQKVCCFPVGD